jgi:hypothetical protein
MLYLFALPVHLQPLGKFIVAREIIDQLDDINIAGNLHEGRAGDEIKQFFFLGNSIPLEGMPGYAVCWRRGGVTGFPVWHGFRALHACYSHKGLIG